jgi:plastocyanin
MSGRTMGMLSVAAATAAIAVLPTGALGGARSASGHTVTLGGVRFHPGTLNINRGESVSWRWNTPNGEHNVTFHGTHSRTGSRGSFTVHFPHAGTFNYVCTVHVSEGMRGKVIVH